MNFNTTILAAAVAIALLAPRSIQSEEPAMKTKWAIVIHGGAGSSPAQLGEASSQKRTAGLQHALQTGRDMLADGATAMDTVEAVIRTLEDDPIFNAGRGSVVTNEGRVEMDSSVMDGKTLACGAVAGVTRVKNPISLARRVMTETKHVLLIGPGADEFAETQQVPLVDPEYFLSQRDGDDAANIASASQEKDESHLGTVGCVVLDSHGNLAAGTSTGGTANKLPGRVGDSPIVGAGTYAANGLCAVSGTGVGEEYIRNSVAYDIAAQMRYANQSLESAITDIMLNRLEPGVGGLIAVSQQGEIVMQHNTPGMSCGAADSTGRFETHLILDNGGAPTTATTEPSQSASEESAITELIQQQASDWNAGDIDAFMKVYWKSDQLTFSSGGEVTRGFDATLQRYKERYPNPEKMGKLTFTDLEFLPLGDSAMQVLGVWKLARTEPMEGKFTLVFRRFPEGWKIVHDHTSKSPDTQDD
ncbi:isoaspartyl peptidase/L-asparaginase [Rhodopirellula europaea]|jgi:beta-aspartyl-peptidase (threonine type)|uniref:Isoaspartyl peptidase n=1 Tax=Rhodopirellula europaea SH398 TaxID=1263868 RepID=M5S4Z0_9BACT|nr:isoaspartyl peptidase/L-asparaginase [Rhodopirellula europaea]EMI26698.1 isoaspartyl aminopeptidase [Rhodopirellula europaea SH398]